jgi:hypothetical protein
MGTRSETAGPEPLTPEESAELLAGLEAAPAPIGMAHRAVERWAQERTTGSARTGLARLLRGYGLRPALAIGAAVGLLLVVRSRMVEVPAPMMDRSSAPVSAGSRALRAATPPEAVPSAKTLRTKGVRKPAAAVKLSAAHPHLPEADAVALKSGMVREKAAAPRVAEHAMLPAPETPSITAPAGGASELAYLNGEAEPEAAEALAARGDARLLTRISLAEDEIALSDLAGRLVEVSGVRIALADSAARGTVGIHCKDRPVGEVLRQIGRALDLRWERAGSGAKAGYAAVAASANEAQLEFGRSRSAPQPPAGVMRGDSEARHYQGLDPLKAASAARRAESKDTPLCIVGRPARVKEIVAGRAAPPETARVEGWIIVK